MLLAFTGLLFAALFIGFPIAVALIGVTWIYAAIKGVPLSVVAHATLNSLDSWSLLAVPLYILMGEVMTRGGITQRLTDLALSVVGQVKGGLAYAATVAGVLLAGISGSATADAAALGSTLIPAMRDKGYSAGFAASVVSAAALMGAVIPPSIPMVIYASLTGVSVGRMFLGGVVPGLLMAVGIAVAIYLTVRRRGYGGYQAFSLANVRRTSFIAIPAISVPAIVVLGLALGYLTSTESGAIAVVVAILIGALFYRELSLRGFLEAGNNTIYMTGAAMFLAAASAGVGKILALENAGMQLSAFLIAISSGEVWLLLLYLNIFLLIVGIFMEPLPMIILLSPILTPVYMQLGIDPVHFGVVMILNLLIGMVTPPVGVVMFIVMSIARIGMREFMMEGWPFFLALVGVLMLITYVPGLVLWLPNLLIPS